MKHKLLSIITLLSCTFFNFACEHDCKSLRMKSKFVYKPVVYQNDYEKMHDKCDIKNNKVICEGPDAVYIGTVSISERYSHTICVPE